MRRLLAAARRSPNLAIAVTVAAVCVSIALATGFWLLFRLAYFLVFAILLVYLWARSMIRSLEVDVVRQAQRVTQGQAVTGRIVVRSTSRLPKLWLEVHDRSTLPSHQSSRLISLGSKGLAAWLYSTPTRRRGLHTLGPVEVTATDPFGFFQFTRTFGEQTGVLVYPSAPELANFYVPPANLPGDGRFRRRTHNITPNVSGVRAYEHGDSFNRIHWPATARTGQLMVKVFELDPASDIWLLLDLEAGVHAGSGDEGTEEAAVTIAASIARTFLAAHRAVGMISFGDTLRLDVPDRGANQYTRLLESLALARASGDIPLADLLLEESRHFGRHTTVVAITPSTAEGWPLALMSLAARGVKVAAVLLEAETFGASSSSLETYGTLTAGGIYTYTVKRNDDLLRALAVGTGSGEADRTRGRATGGEREYAP